MNKRISLIAAAVFVLSSVLTACDDKEKPKPQDTTVNEDTGDTLVTEPVYREYSEDDFVEVGKTHCYAIAQVDISIDELARRLFELSKQYPFSQYIAGKEIISHGNYKYKKYGMVFDPDSMESVIADGGYKNDPEADTHFKFSLFW